MATPERQLESGPLENRITRVLTAAGQAMTAREISEQVGEETRLVLYALKSMRNVVRLKEPSDTGEVRFRTLSNRDFIVRGLFGW